MVSYSQVEKKKKNIEEKKCSERKEVTFFLSLLHLG
jgi:hypothetical protein